MTDTDVTDTFYVPCFDCGGTIHIAGGQRQPHECLPLDLDPDNQWAEMIGRAWWAGHDAVRSRSGNRADHDIHPGDTIGDYTITDINQDHDSHNLTLTIEATGNPPAWFGAPVIKISRGEWHSYLLRNEFGGGYRAADGSLHAVNQHHRSGTPQRIHGGRNRTMSDTPARSRCWLPAPEELAPWDQRAVLDAKRCLWADSGSRSAPVFTTAHGVPRRAQPEPVSPSPLPRHHGCCSCPDCRGGFGGKTFRL